MWSGSLTLLAMEREDSIQVPQVVVQRASKVRLENGRDRQHHSGRWASLPIEVPPAEAGLTGERTSELPCRVQSKMPISTASASATPLRMMR